MVADVVYLVVMFIYALLVPGEAGVDCNDSWNVTIEDNFLVKWSGEEREAYVRIHVKPDTSNGTDTKCSHKILNVPFAAGEVRIESPCANTLHLVDASLVCKNSSTSSEIVYFRIQSNAPGAPTNVSAVKITNSSITLEWNEPSSSSAPIVGYDIRESKTKDFSTSPVKHANDTTFELGGLDPYTYYFIEVSARTETGNGPWSTALTVRTDVGVPSEPRNLTVMEVTNTSLLIAWENPQYPNGPLLAYVIKLLKHDSNRTNLIETKSTNCAIEGLSPYTNYSVKVRAQTEAGSGPWTEDLTFRTGIGIPGAPQNVSTTKVLSTSITVEWSTPGSASGPLVGYSLNWGVQGTTASFVVTDSPVYTAIGLRPYTEYFFKVAAITKAGDGPSASVIVRTNIAAPSLPRDPGVVKKTEDSITLNWILPEHPNGPQIWYAVRWADLSDNSAIKVERTNSTSYQIESLKSSTNYSVQIAAQTSVGQSPWTEMLFVQTSSKSNSTFVLALVLGILLPLLVILLSVGAIIAKRKGAFEFLRSKLLKKCPPKRKTSFKNSNTPVQLGIIHLTSNSLNVQNFEEQMRHPLHNSRVDQEFSELREKSPQHSCNVAKLEANLPKNRWGKVLPFDNSRVKLLAHGDKIRPDFINANYIPGDSYLLEYIATQGPLRETLDDFWMMVWQQSVSVIVMLTQCVEKAVRNCEQYWPASGQSKVFGHIQVQSQSESVLTSYIVRVFSVQHRSEKRKVIHMHFSNWPVSGSPRSPDEFLHFVRKVRDQISERRPGPILVHCSAGVGRTGTFIAVDRLLQHLQHSDDVDIYNTVLDLRRYRPHMVHTEDQYIFIYSCIQRLLEERKVPQESLYEILPE